MLLYCVGIGDYYLVIIYEIRFQCSGVRRRGGIFNIQSACVLAWPSIQCSILKLIKRKDGGRETAEPQNIECSPPASRDCVDGAGKNAEGKTKKILNAPHQRKYNTAFLCQRHNLY